MHRLWKIIISVGLFLLLATPACAALTDVLSEMNLRAQADAHDFSVRLSSRFGVPEVEIHSLLRQVKAPADAFMCLQLSHMTGYAPRRVVEVHQRHQNKGWGVIARQLGIKPGSAAFHQIKQGHFDFYAATGKKNNKGTKKQKKQK